VAHIGIEHAKGLYLWLPRRRVATSPAPPPNLLATTYAFAASPLTESSSPAGRSHQRAPHHPLTTNNIDYTDFKLEVRSLDCILSPGHLTFT